jgi:hypothetical protein
MSQDLRSLGAFMLVVMVIICLPTIFKGIGVAIIFLLKCAAAIMLGYIAVAIVVGLLMMIFNFKGNSDDATEVEKAWKF